MKLHLLVYSAGNTTVKCEADILVMEPFFFPATIDLEPKANSLVSTVVLFFFTVRMLIAVAEIYIK